MVKKQPIIFDDNLKQDYVEGEQMMDLLLHYAQSGIYETEKLMREEPDMFNDDDLLDFAANKVVLAKAPDILEDYKNKVREFEQMHDKVQGIVSKCENIVLDYEARKHPEEAPIEQEDMKDQPTDFSNQKTIKYTEDGHIIMETRSAGVRKNRRVMIELKKTSDY